MASQRISINFEGDKKEILQTKAKKTGRSLSKLIGSLLIDWMDNHDDKELEGKEE